MKLFGVLLVLSMSIWSCSSLKEVRQSKSCYKSLDQLITLHWRRNSYNTIDTQDSILNEFIDGRLPESKCLMGLSKEQVMALFGTPDRINDSLNQNNIWYYSHPTCQTPNSTYCVYIHFDFNKKDIYQSIGISGWTLSF